MDRTIPGVPSSESLSKTMRVCEDARDSRLRDLRPSGNELFSITRTSTLPSLLNRPISAAYISVPPEFHREQERIFLEHLELDPGFTQLAQNQYFQDCIDSFIEFRKEQENSGNALPERPFVHFVSEVVYHLSLLAQFRQERDIKLFASKATINAARRHVSALLEMERDGLVGIVGWKSFKEGLREFEQVLAIETPAPGKRAKRADATQLERKFISDLAVTFLHVFGDPLRRCLINLSMLIEYSNNDSVIDERIHDARSRFRPSSMREPSPG